MKQFSIWASQNRRQSFWIMVILSIFLGTFASFLGILLEDLGIVLPFQTVHVLTFVFLGLYFFYPLRHHKIGLWKNSYLRRKTFDSALLTVGFLMWLAFSNIPTSVEPNAADFSFTEITPSVNTVHAEIAVPQVLDNQGVVQKIKNARRGVWETLRDIKKFYRSNVLHSERKSKSEIAWRLVFILLGTIIIAYITLALACSAACGGNNALAVVVALLGLGLIVTLFVTQIRKIKILKQQQEMPTTNS